MLNIQRSVVSLIIIIAFGTGSAIFVVKKSNEAADELERLNSGVFTVHRAAFTRLSDNESESGIIDTSNWKIYRNEQYGFEVKYPSTFFLFTRTEPNKYGISEFAQPTANSRVVKITDKEEMLYCCEPLIFSIEANDRMDNLEQFIEDQKIIIPQTEYRIKSKGDEYFAGERAYRIYSSTGIDSSGNIIVLNHGKYTFLIRSATLDNHFVDILNNFKFTK